MTELLSLTDYQRIAEDLRLPVNAYINGKFTPPANGRYIDSINPATEQVITQIAACDAEDVDTAVKHARFAFNKGTWSKAPLNERKEILIRWAKLIKRHVQELATLESIDSGKPISDCIEVDLPEVINTLIWYAETIDKIYDQIAPTGDTTIASIIKEPVGVVGAVLPWNFPLLMAAWKLGPALATGNSVIVKPAEETSMSLLRMAELATEAGLPKGVLQILPGHGKDVGQAIGLHPDIDMVTFTGSTVTGRRFLNYSAESNLKKITLELGGKNPFVVLDDAVRLEAIADHAINATFWNMGENCSSGSRIIIHQDIYDELVPLIVERAQQLSMGDPLDPKTKIGPMVSKNHYDKVKQYIDLGQSTDYVQLTGKQEPPANGYYIAPTVFEAVDNEHALAQEEIFGPVMCIIKAQSNEQAITLANQTEYGLSASLFGRDIVRVNQYARAIKAGTVTVNCFGEGDITTPFGGYKLSGFGGRDKGLEALLQYTESKTIWLDLDE